MKNHGTLDTSPEGRSFATHYILVCLIQGYKEISGESWFGGLGRFGPFKFICVGCMVVGGDPWIRMGTPWEPMGDAWGTHAWKPMGVWGPMGPWAPWAQGGRWAGGR